jgi:hypothetical protein
MGYKYTHDQTARFGQDVLLNLPQQSHIHLLSPLLPHQLGSAFSPVPILRRSGNELHGPATLPFLLAR